MFEFTFFSMTCCLQNEYVLNKLWIVANLCEIGLQDFTINNAVDNVCNALGRQNFDY